MPPKFVKPPTVDTQDLMSTVTALVAALGGMGLKFAIVGGLACRLMGSQRYTQASRPLPRQVVEAHTRPTGQDVDVVIEVGEDDDSLSDISDRLGQRAGFVKDRIGTSLGIAHGTGARALTRVRQDACRTAQTSSGLSSTLTC